MQYITEEKLRIFKQLFRGRSDVFAKRWEKNGKSGYSPAYDIDWIAFQKHQATGGNLKTFEQKTLLALTDDTIRKHLLGGYTIGLYPLLLYNTSYFIAVDFDKNNWLEDTQRFIARCQDHKISAHIELSRSGNGSHVWIFFAEAYTAFKSRAIVKHILKRALGISDFAHESSYDRMFPNQDSLEKEGFGNLIALPLNGQSLEKGTTVFIDPITAQPYPNQWEFLSSITPMSQSQLDELYSTICDTYHDQSSKQTNVIEITIREQLYLSKTQLNSEITQFLKDELYIANAEYFLKKKLGKSTYKIESHFKLITDTAQYIKLPRGFLPKLQAYLKEKQIAVSINDERQKRDSVKFDVVFNLYAHQQKVLTKIADSQSGVIIAPPGAGKTVVALAKIAQLQQPALILVHRKQLFDQWIERIETFLHIPRTQIGQISGAKKKVGNQVTVAMIQSVTKMKNISDLNNKCGVLIVDECHHVPAKTFRDTVSLLDPYYTYGLTATPKRKYGDEKLIHYYLGEIISKIEKQDTVHHEVDNTIHVHINQTSLKIPFSYKTDEFELLSKVLIFDSTRNVQIVTDAVNEYKKGNTLLLLTERKEHVDVLLQYLKKLVEVCGITGDDSAQKRKAKIDQIQNGEVRVVIATGQLFGEGVDIAHFNCLFLCYPCSFEGKLIQYIGRIQRSQGQKVIYDYRDSHVEYLEKMFKKRQRYYKKADLLRN